MGKLLKSWRIRILLILILLVGIGAFTWSCLDQVSKLRLKANLGDARSQFYLGSEVYGSGYGEIAKDSKQAFKWIRMSADKGYPMAQLDMGAMYAKGMGVPKDEAESLKWYHKAAENWRKSAEHGDADSQLWLGVMHRDGLGMGKDPVEAYKCFILASAEPRQLGVACRDQISKQMTPEEISEGKQRASAFVARK